MKCICDLRQKMIKSGIFLPTLYLSRGFGTAITPPLLHPVNFVRSGTETIQPDLNIVVWGVKVSICNYQYFRELFLETSRGNVHSS